MNPTWIAEEAVVFLYLDGRRVPGRVAVSLPVQVDDIESYCLVALDGFTPRPTKIIGGSRLQPLTLTVRFLGKRMHDFVCDGGRILHPAEDFVLQSYFGQLLRRVTDDQSPDDQPPIDDSDSDTE
jgi:hypothetical protein